MIIVLQAGSVSKHAEFRKSCSIRWNCDCGLLYY